MNSIIGLTDLPPPTISPLPGVEMKPAALAILRQRAAAAGLANVATFVGMIETFEEPFDVALALHACGNATDAAMLRAEQHRAAYIVSSPTIRTTTLDCFMG